MKMKYTEFVIEKIRKADFEIKLLLSIFYAAINIMYFSALMIIALNDKILPDYNTAFYWMNELVIGANKLFASAVIPLLIYQSVAT